MPSASVQDSEILSLNHSNSYSNSTTHRSSDRWLPGLDLLRASAVFLVLIGHGKVFLPTQARAVFDSIFPMPAAWGVEFFFSLSGFLIGKQWLEIIHSEKARCKTRAIRLFLLKRWLRTMPTFWLCFGLVSALGLVNQGTPLTLWLIGNFFLVAELVNTTPAIPVSWTLTIEELGYLVFGISAFAFKKSAESRNSTDLPIFTMPALLITAGSLARAHAIESGAWNAIIHGPIQRIDALAYGCILACILRRKRPHDTGSLATESVGRLNHIAWAGLLFLIGILQFWCEHNLIKMAPGSTEQAFIFGLAIIPLFGATSSLATALFSEIKPGYSPLTLILMKPVRHLAKVSYSVYLVHIPLRGWMQAHGISASGYSFLAFIMASIVIGSSIYLVFEAPFLILRKRMILKTSQFIAQ